MPLHLAASSGHIDIVQYLIDSGTGINIKNRFGVSESNCSGDLSLSSQVLGKGSSICLHKYMYTVG